MKKRRYISDVELTYELILSKGKGKMTKNLEVMLILLSSEIIKKFSYIDEDDRYDCHISGLLALFENWNGFNSDRYDKSFSYLSEIFKRSAAKQLNEISGIGKYTKDTVKIRFDDWSRF